MNQQLYNNLSLLLEQTLKGNAIDASQSTEQLFIIGKIKSSAKVLFEECATLKDNPSPKSYFTKLCLIAQLAKNLRFWLNKHFEFKQQLNLESSTLLSQLDAMIEVIGFSINVINYQETLS
ncbi:MAG: hypothetical protein RIQ89_411 [Bacteroidota bacterium]|jgi:hypothetical protein